MKNVLILVLVFLATFSFGQEVTSSDLKVDSTDMFKNNPSLVLYGLNNSFRSAQLLQEELDLHERLNVYRKKQNTRQWIGAGMMGVGLGGLWYVAEMHEPIYQIGNAAVNDAADEQKRKRRIIAWPSAIVAGAGAILFVDSFKFSKWTKLELGIANVKISHELYHRGGRKYFRGKESEVMLQKKSLWRKSYPRYHR